MSGGRNRGYPISGRSRPISGGAGRPFTKKSVFGRVTTKNLYGPAGHGKVHYQSRVGMKARFSARQNAHNAFTSQFIRALPKPGNRAGARRNMAMAQAEWVRQNGRVVYTPQVVR